MPEGEDRLLGRAAAGDRRALQRLYVLHVDSLHAFVYFKVGCNAALAEDAVQDTFLKALAEAASFDPARGSLRAWLLETSRNVIRGYLNRNQRLESLDIDSLADRLAHDLEGDAAPIAEELLVRREVQALVVATIERLPGRYRTLLELKYMAGASLEELASELTLSTEAVKSQLARARRAFRETFLAASRSRREVSHGR
jgi:RNA polymerase sigma-70 factor (ECF subfamily)